MVVEKGRVQVRVSSVRILWSILICLILSGLATISAAAEENHQSPPSSFYGTVLSYIPGDVLVARARLVGTAGGGVETFHLTPQTTLGDRVPQVGDGVGIKWQGTSPAGLIALKVYAFAGGMHDQSTSATATPTSGVVANATPVPSATPTSTARRHGFYGTVTSFTPPTDGQPGSLIVRPQETDSSGGGPATFQVTTQTVFHEVNGTQVMLPQVGDWVAVASTGGSPESLVATAVYVRPATAISTDQVPAVDTRSPAPDAAPLGDSASASHDQTVAGMLVAYIAPLDAEDGLVEIRVSRPGATGEQPVESFLIPAGTQVDVASVDGSTPVGTAAALSWVLRGNQRVALSLAIG
jgi:hypothetical protein